MNASYPFPSSVVNDDATVVNEDPHEASHIGNACWMFGNWGMRAKAPEMQANIDVALKRGPCTVLALAECMKQTQELLEMPPGENEFMTGRGQTPAKGRRSVHDDQGRRAVFSANRRAQRHGTEDRVSPL